MADSSRAIFLSYASEDEAAATAVCEALRSAGLSVWFDQNELRGGEAWDASIRRQIAECDLFLPLITPNTDTRGEGYFRLEWKLAVDRSHLMADDRAFLMPVLLGHGSEAGARVPDAFRSRQWLRLRDPSATDALVARARQLLDAETPFQSTPAIVQDDGRPERNEDGFRLAVLPFGHRGAMPGVEALADGLGEEIVTGLSRFSYLRVIASGSSADRAGSAVDLRAIGRKLGARYVMHGSVRQAGPSVRISAQLVDVLSGAHLWADQYDRPYEPDAVFTLLDDLAPRIVATVADMHGVLLHTMSEDLRSRDPAALTPYEAVLSACGYIARIDRAEYERVRQAMEHAVRQAPHDADVWAMVSHVAAEAFKHGFDEQSDSLDRALEAARRAVAAAPASSLGYHVLAQALFFRRDLQGFRNAAERAIALNPMDACTIAFMGILICYAGDWERGLPLAERAMTLNPHHPGWYRFAAFNHAMEQRDFAAALAVAKRFNMPSYFYTHFALATAAGHLGDSATAAQALAELLAQRPDFGVVARDELGRWYVDVELLELSLEGLRKAGLAIAD